MMPLAIFALLAAEVGEEKTANITGSGILAFPVSFGVTSTNLSSFYLLHLDLTPQGVLLLCG